MAILGYVGKAKVSTKNLMNLPMNVTENYRIKKGDLIKFFSEEAYMALDDKELQKEVDSGKVVVMHIIVERSEARKNGK